MSKRINIGFNLAAAIPLEDRLVVERQTDLDAILFPYEGLLTYVTLTEDFYVYRRSGWEIYSSLVTTAAEWGNISGSITSQVDLMQLLNSKLSKQGGTITGPLSITGQLTAQNILTSRGFLDDVMINSTIEGEPTGAIAIENIVLISKADYDQAELDGTLVLTTKYLII